MRGVWRSLVAAVMALGSTAASGQDGDDAAFQAYLQTLRAQAIAQGVRPATADGVIATLTLNPRVIELDRSQPGGGPSTDAYSPISPYLRQHVTPALIARGRDKYLAQRPRLARIEATTGVPESIMVAIWGHETGYGAVMGKFDLPRALATLAFEGRRRQLFAPEFIATLKIIDRGVPRAKLVGSWAGAMGGPQFLPSVYLARARDGDGDGVADIWSSDADTLASIGNYFYQAAWRRGQPWGLAVALPAGFDRASVANRLISPRCPRVFARASGWRTIAEWRAMGVQSLGRPWPADNVLATMMEPDGPGQGAYLLTGNYRVILDYNCSNAYALSVGLLADAIEQ